MSRCHKSDWSGYSVIVNFVTVSCKFSKNELFYSCFLDSGPKYQDAQYEK